MKRFLVGTAGHIDHGKTALVKALTGIDADRLPEEKRRGITIDLGFAHAEWEGVRVSFVDVPGHERFVRNMLAGAGGIEAVLLVVAADESVMPQTREHFEIVRLLGLSRGVVAVTKTDRASRRARRGHDLRRARSRRAARFWKARRSCRSPRRRARGSRRCGRRLTSLASRTRGARSASRGAIRLPIDRAFLIPGFGPVVTGSLVSGTSSAGTRSSSCFRSGGPVRVRRVEVHGREEEIARAGERVSANLVGVELGDLHRGMVLASPGALPVSKRLLARLDLLPGAPPTSRAATASPSTTSRRRRGRASACSARAQIESGGSAARRAPLWRQAVAAIPGDRFVVRRLSPVETIGGGVVLDPEAPSPARPAG